jgi:DNA replication protein DnaC
MKQSGISEEFCNKGFNEFETFNDKQLENAKSKAIDYYRRFSRIEHEKCNSILFSGQVGAGKTHLGVAICSNLMNHCSVAVTYMMYRNVITKLKQNLLDEEEYIRELEKYANARLLYIDDMLKGRITDADVNIMYEIINYRYMNRLPLVLSTEKSPQQLLEFDEAIGSRILEMCKGNIVYLQGKELNYRTKNRGI